MGELDDKEGQMLGKLGKKTKLKPKRAKRGAMVIATCVCGIEIKEGEGYQHKGGQYYCQKCRDDT